jgi:hypothetical protein
MIALAPMALAAALAAAPVPSTVEPLAWMEGTWTGEKDGIRMEEVWTGVRGGALLGLHSDVKAGRLVGWEFFRIAVSDGRVVYHSSPRSAPPTPFTLVEAGPRRAVFENKGHDFRQRILYWIDDAGAMHARIEGPQDGRTASEEWVWTRAR